ncbi:hypothetical protein EIP86_004839 [Pleurotus ostreatoroseus]|nr:hypothetical protein EIP86_004839 [Pleurotus ostreatoroseus]
MSRIPPPATSSRNTTRTPIKKPSTTSLRAGASTSVRKPPPSPTPGSRTSQTLRPQPSVKSLRSPTTATPRSPSKRTAKPVEDEPLTPKTPTLSIREQIALKRAEAKKAVTTSTPSNRLSSEFSGLEDAVPTGKVTPEDNAVDLGRWSIKETIERARSTGAINLASRALPCLPSALFEIHLGIKPEPLKLVPVEPPITTASSDDFAAKRRNNASDNGPSWYEAQDLGVLKAWSNEILEIQPEISMFGSLKNIDLHNNKLTFLPDSFADLASLASLDLSHNELVSLPANLFALPNLTNLNLSHNALTSLPFVLPFASSDANPLARTRDPRGDWYCESITRATVPLPKLVALNVSNNQITAASIDHKAGQLPAALTKLDLSVNPLGKSVSLLRALAKLEHLHEIRCEKADIGDDSFPVDLLGSNAGGSFPALTLLDLGETNVTRPVIEVALVPSAIKQQLDFEVTTQDPKHGTLRIIIGKKIVKEAWEVEAERRVAGRGRGTRHAPAPSDVSATPTTLKEDWELEAEQGLLTEGAKRRARAAAAAAASDPSSPATSAPAAARTTQSNTPFKPRARAVEKEAWEIEAEQGLLTAGGRRRARAAAAAAALSVSTSSLRSPSDPGSATSASPTRSAPSALSQPQYYTAATQTLVLPTSVAPSKSQHMRSFSSAPTSAQVAQAKAVPGLAIPTPTLPLVAILSQSFAHSLKVLTLTNRRMDPSFSLPSLDSAEGSGPFLPCLEELSLEGCSLGNTVPVSRSTDGSSDLASSRKNEPLLPLITKLFPSLRTLDLSYNTLKSEALDKDTLADLILASDPNDSLNRTSRKGLRHLRLRGNRITELDGFQGLAEMFKGNRDVPTWKLEELDLRDNEVGKLPAEIGLLPLDVFLVDGNVYVFRASSST